MDDVIRLESEKPAIQYFEISKIAILFRYANVSDFNLKVQSYSAEKKIKLFISYIIQAQTYGIVMSFDAEKYHWFTAFLLFSSLWPLLSL